MEHAYHMSRQNDFKLLCTVQVLVATMMRFSDSEYMFLLAKENETCK